MNDNFLEPVKLDVDCEAVKRLIPAYSLGMTDADDSAFVEAHLADCPEASAELEEYEQLAQKLLFSAPFRRAPAHLRERLQTAVRLSKATDGRHVSAKSASRVSPWLHKKSAFTGLFSSRFGAAHLLVTLFLLVGSNVYWMAQLSNIQQQMTARFADYDAALALVGAEETQRIVLTSQKSDAQVEILYDADKKLGFLYTEKLSRLAADRAYQLWLVHDDRYISAGVFQVNQDGEAVVVFRVAQPIAEFESAIVTEERAGGNPQPTTDPIATGMLGD